MRYTIQPEGQSGNTIITVTAGETDVRFTSAGYSILHRKLTNGDSFFLGLFTACILLIIYFAVHAFLQ